MNAETGNNISILCSIRTNEVQWFFWGGPLPHNAVVEYGFNLQLINVQLLNSGLYTCKSESDLEVVKDGIFILVKGTLGLRYYHDKELYDQQNHCFL